jgi:hypothetical protein
MRLSLFLIPALMVSALSAQGPGFYGRRSDSRGVTSTPPAPPTPQQAATQEVNRIVRALSLNTTDATALQTDLACASSATTLTTGTPCALTVEQNVLDTNAATAKTNWTSLIANLSDSSAVAAINAAELSDLQTRVAAASAVLEELANLKITLTAAQQTNVVTLLVRGGAVGNFHR